MNQGVDIVTAAADPPILASIEPSTGRARPTRKELLAKPWVLRLLSLIVVIVGWQLIGAGQPYSITTPSAIIQAGYHDMTGEVLPAFGDTLKGFWIGYAVCVLVGIPFGLLMARSRLLELAFAPYVSALYATPRLALIPVLILWLGVSFQLRLAVVIVSGLFPIVLNSYIGGKEVDRNQIEVGLAFAANRYRVLRTIIVPGSLHYVFAGLRIGFGRAMIGIIVAEIEASVVGVGNLLSTDAGSLRISSMWVPIIMLGLFSIVCNVILKWLERWMTMPWTRSQRRLVPWPSRP
jgi:ABC-type nitrate/sulfonate/bicarbonate transport system permease component